MTGRLFRDHKGAWAAGSLGVAIVLGHVAVVLAVMVGPLAAAIFGAVIGGIVILTGLVLFLLLSRHLKSGR
jgi:hypothetical protein